MDQTTRSQLQRATQDARRLLEAEFAAQLEGTYDILPDGRVLPGPGAHLDDRQRLTRRKIVEAIEHLRVKESGKTQAQAVDDYTREAAFTALNRFVALKMLEARGLVQQCVSKGDQSGGFKEFTGLAPGLADLPDKGYQLYLECLFDELGTEVKVLFDRREPASLLWPRRQTVLDLIAILNRSELESVWDQDETIGWVYQYFNGQEERRAMRDASAAPRNSRELAVRNQFFTPRYVVEFLTDNTLGRIWYEMRQGRTVLKEHCRYLVRRPSEVFLSEGENPPDTTENQGTLSQEELLKQPHYILFRPKKDPRDLKILDPACGSGHFLLYCFELLILIYLEDWGETSPMSEAAGNSLRADYPTLDEFHSALPGLILRHNLHGIDIDPRCAQIAALALWMRAQRAFKDFEISRDQRPAIRKTNIVVAEPMPGEPEILDGFLCSLQEDRLETLIRSALHIAETQRVRATKAMADSLCQLVRTVWEKMKLAGEAGSLLKIDTELATAIEEGREEWEEKMPLFRVTEYALDGVSSERYYRQLPGEDHDFWDKAETLTLHALEEYAVGSQNGDQFRRNMFAEDAMRGFAFIDLCRQRYDVALMNPPFGDASLPSKPYLDDTYGDTKGDIYKAFVECFHARLVPAGYLGIISSRTGFFLGQSEDWRTRVVLRLFRPIVLADLGSGVLDAMVEVAAYVLRSLSAAEARELTLSLVPVLEKVVLDRQERFSLPKWQAARDGLKRHQAVAELEHLESAGFIQRSAGDIVRYSPLWRMAKAVTPPLEPVFPPLVCIRALAEEEKGYALAAAVHGNARGKVFVCDPKLFRKIPSSPFAYWVGEKVMTLFDSLPKVQAQGRDAVIGASTKDDFRFLRLGWEIDRGLLARTRDETSAGRVWVSLAKGGTFSQFYADPYLAIQWRNDGHEIKAAISEYRGSRGWGYQWTAALNGHDYYFRPGLTWPSRTNGLSFRVLPRGCISGAKGPCVFVEDDDSATLLALNSLVSSLAFRGLVGLQLARVDLAQSYEAGVIQRTPLPHTSPTVDEVLRTAANRAWCQKRALDVATPTSHAFTSPALLIVSGTTLGERAASWAARKRTSVESVASIQAEIDDLAFRLYGLDPADRAALTATLATEIRADSEAGTSEEDGEETAPAADASALTADLLDYALGAAFGRWDVRLATGQKPAPPEPAPFDSLSVCPPGMLQNAAGLPATPADVPADYPLHLSWTGILVDDPGHDENIEIRLKEVLAVLWPDRSDAIAREACELCGVRILRDFFRKPAGFFADHLKRYSKSRRQAPIYWPLSSSNGGYTIWLYYHRFRRDTLSLALEDYAKPKLRYEVKKLSQLREEAGTEPTPSQRDSIEAQATLVSEISGFVEELANIAPLWNPDLNDGVIINYAPLWRLITHTPWRKNVKKCWDALVAGEYDWAHLAMHLWPERVVPKCVTDRSLAIAHRLEDVFWVEGTNSRRKPRSTPARLVEELVLERSSSAVKSALNCLLEAPLPSGGTKRGRRGKTHA